MFTILGGDGKEYGPATPDQVRAWIQSGRANLDTRAKLPGETEWRRLGDIPEFNGTAADTPPPLGAPVENAPVSAPLVPAGRGTRFLAVVLDRLIESACTLPGLLLLGPAFFRLLVDAFRGRQPDFNAIDIGSAFLGIALLGLGGLAITVVQVVMVSTRGQSLGKRILGLRIVRFGTGAPAGFLHGWLLRAVVPGIISCLPWIGYLFLIVNYCFIFREDRRCLHDLIADTCVVKK